MTHYSPPKTLCLSLLAASVILASQTLSAQEAEPAADDKSVIEKIEVTARKRAESIQEIPLAVSALISDDIEKRGIVQVKDLADNTPGLVVSNNFSGKADRSVQTFTLRGFSPSSGAEATTSMFIDGVPVSSTTAVSSIGTPSRVEILRGPQSAYFGRNTFAGAINVVNREPLGDLAGFIDLTTGNYGYKRFRGEVEGAIIEDKLSARASYETYQKDGFWDNKGPDGGKLGEQKTSMANLYILAQPTDELTIKAFGFMSHDEDGPAAAALLSAVDLFDVAGNKVVTGQSNCTLGPASGPYFCGELPTKVDPITYNTNASDALKAFLKNPTGRIIDTDRLSNYGMDRETYHGHIVVDWEIGDTGFTLSSLTGVNKEEWIILNDIDHYYSPSFNYGFLVEKVNEDFSQELRLTYDNNGPFSGTVGLSYLDATQDGSLTQLIQFPFGEIIPPQVSQSGEGSNKTTGLFFGSSYELSDKATISAEGRFQRDTIATYAADGTLLVEEDFTNFLPRVIVDYKFSDDLMAYATYSKGVNPAAFNTGLLAVSETVRQQASDAGIGLTVDPEEVDNYEIGFKGTGFDGSMTYAVGVYYADWTKQINRVNLVLTDEDGTPTSFSGVANAGHTTLQGIEAEVNWMLTSDLRLNFSGAMTDSEIKDFSNLALTQLTGISDYSGKEMPNTSKYSGNIGLQYDGTFNGEYDYFGRIDYIYKDGLYSNQANFLKTPDIHLVNLRAGITFGDFSVQAYVKNLFDDDSYTFAYDYYAFDYSFAYFALNTATVASFQEPRTVGLQVKWTFSEY